MPYVPINVLAYTTAFSGAMAGMAATGWLTDPTSSDYSTATAAAGAYAEAFDTAWNSPTALNNLESRVIVAASSQNFTNRGPAVGNVALTLAANWHETAVAVVALTLQSDMYFVAQGINPGTDSGGSSSLNPYAPETYLPPGTTPAMVDAANGWALYIAAALDTVGGCELANRSYNTNETVVIASGQSIWGVGPLSAIEPKQILGFNGLAIFAIGTPNAGRITLRGFTVDSKNLFPNVSQIKFNTNAETGSYTRVKIQDINLIDFDSLDSTVDSYALSFTGFCDIISIDGLYVEQNVHRVDTTRKAIAVNIQNQFGPKTNSVRVTNSNFNCKNLVYGMTVNGGAAQGFLRGFSIEDSNFWGSDFGGFLFGYTAANDVYLSRCVNCTFIDMGGPGVYVGGNDGVTPGVGLSTAFVIDGCIFAYCGALNLGSFFATSIKLSSLGYIINGNYVLFTGYNSDGTARPFAAESIAIHTNGQGLSSNKFQAILTNNWINKSAVGMVGEELQYATIATNVIVDTVIAMGFSSTGAPGVSGYINIHSNVCAECTNYGCQADGYGVTNSVYWNYSGNQVGMSGGAYRIGLYVSNVFNGEFGAGCSITNATEGVRLTANMTGVYVGTSVLFQGFRFVNCATDVIMFSVSSVLGLVGPNYSNGATPINGNAYVCLSNGPVRKWISTATPSPGDLQGGCRVGDEIQLAAPGSAAAGTIYGYKCAIAGNPGTWGSLKFG